MKHITFSCNSSSINEHHVEYNVNGTKTVTLTGPWHVCSMNMETLQMLREQWGIDHSEELNKYKRLLDVCLSKYDTEIKDIREKLLTRVDELLKANNEELERRRAVEKQLAEAEAVIKGLATALTK